MNVNFATAPMPQKAAGGHMAKDAKNGDAGLETFDDTLSTRPGKQDTGTSTVDIDDTQPVWNAAEFARRFGMNPALVGDADDSVQHADTLPVDEESAAPDAIVAAKMPAQEPSALSILNSFVAAKRDGDAQPEKTEQQPDDDDAKAQLAKMSGGLDAEGALPDQTVATDTKDVPRAASVGAEVQMAAPARERQQPSISKGISGGASATEIRPPASAVGPLTSDAVERPGPVAEKPQAASDKPAIPAQSTGGGEKSAQIAPTIDPLAARVTVLAANNALAPAQIAPQTNVTTAGLVSAMESDPTWRAVAQDPEILQRTPGQPHGVNSLKIQLNPAELGIVTARLTATGSQLSIEVRVESKEAHLKLTTDSDSIIKALRAVGFDVEKVTIQQAPATNSSAQQSMGGREQSMSNQQAQSENGARQQGERNAAGRDGEGGRHASGEAPADRSGSDLYI